MAKHVERILEVGLNQLRLDKENFRFVDGTSDEPEAFETLFREYDVMSIAKSLVIEGYKTTDIPLVIEDDNSFVVLEANRRISALRALKNPNLVPSHKQELEALIKRYQADVDELPDRIHVSIYPDRAAAAPVLARMHIGTDKKRWEPDEQANFVMAQLADGKDVQYLKETLPGIKDIGRVLRMGRIREAMHKVNFYDESLREYALSRELKMSVFEYAYKDKRIAELAGIAFNKNHEIEHLPTSPGEILVLERVLRGFKTKELGTRKVLNSKKSAEFQGFVRELEEIVQTSELGSQLPDEYSKPENASSTHTPAQSRTPEIPSSLNEATSFPSLTQVADEDAPANSMQSRVVGPNNPKLAKRLNITGVTKQGLPGTMLNRFYELQTLDLDNQANAAAILLRATVEGAIKQFLTKHNKNSSGTLGRVVQELNGMKIQEINTPLNLLLQKNVHKPGTVTWFNGPAHDVSVTVNKKEVHEAYSSLEQLLIFLLG